MRPITIVQGAQWGSEAKGTVAGWLAENRNFAYAVRTGAINAGHTVYYKGKPYVNQQLPVAWVNPNTQLVIGPGAYIHMPTLELEIQMIHMATGVDPRPRLFVDYRAAVHLDEFVLESKGADRHRLIGATGKGCAEAAIHKMKDRGVRDLIASRMWPNQYQYVDTPSLLSSAYHDGGTIMLEGTQGEDLDFHLGPWPYVTSRQTTPAAWVAEAGLSPSLDYEIVLVARTYPIRVAGNSGPMPMETSWPSLSRTINFKLDEANIGNHPLRVSEDALIAYDQAVSGIGYRAGIIGLGINHIWGAPEREQYKSILSTYSSKAFSMLGPTFQAELRRLFEFTTVTKKLRRIALYNRASLTSTVHRLNPAWVCVTFLNYEFPECHGVTPSDAAVDFARSMCPRVQVVSTGPLPDNVYVL
jgi:adenylosuccinate synthase